MGIGLMADGKFQSQGRGCEGFKAGAEKVCLGLNPAVWRQRKQEIQPSKERTLHRLLTFGAFLYMLQCVPLVVSSTSELHSSSTAGMVWCLGAGCTQVGTWLLLGNSSTRLSGISSSLYVHANWDRIPPSLAWNEQDKTTTLIQRLLHRDTVDDQYQ